LPQHAELSPCNEYFGWYTGTYDQSPPPAVLRVTGSDVSGLAPANHIFRRAGVPLLQGVNQVEVVARDASGAAIAVGRVSGSR